MNKKQFINNSRILVSTRQSIVERINKLYPNIKTFSKKLMKAIEELENYKKIKGDKI
jgi:hypothetical protein